MKWLQRALMPSLHAAAAKGDRALVEDLLDRGALVNAKDKSGRTPLHAAAENGHAAVVKLLLANGADAQATDARGSTPLALASENGKATVVTILQGWRGRPG